MIRVVRTSYKDIREFFDREWQEADVEHYGERLDWKKRKLILKAVVDGETAGVVKIKTEAGVAEIEAIVVAKDWRGEGVGKALMKRAEALVKARGCHFIDLVTGKDWAAVGFYEALGYKKLQVIPRYNHKKDFLEFYKHI